VVGEAIQVASAATYLQGNVAPDLTDLTLDMQESFAVYDPSFASSDAIAGPLCPGTDLPRESLHLPEAA
jgi:hypothetical protein